MIGLEWRNRHVCHLQKEEAYQEIKNSVSHLKNSGKSEKELDVWD